MQVIEDVVHCAKETGRMHGMSDCCYKRFCQERGMSIIGTGGGAHVGCAQRFWFSHKKEGTCLVKGPSPDVVASCKPPSRLPIPSLPYIWPPPPPLSGLEISPLFAVAHIPFSPPLRAAVCFSTRGRKEGRDRKHQPW